MSSQFLQTELANLVHESRRKNSDLRNAAEQSLNELKALPSTSEAQIAADLVRKPNFVEPFIIACHTRHAKLAGIGVICLQRLIASRSLPSSRLKDVLGGLKETTSLSLDIQLKILQSLPSLLQFYSNELSGELLANTLEICATLQASKTIAVSSTAAATLQQLVVSTFERVSSEDSLPKDTKITTTIKVDGQSLDIGYFAYDALQVLDDLCRLIDGEPLQFLRTRTLSPTFVLELIESILLNSGRLFVGHPELSQVLRVRLLPLAVRCLSERYSFAQTVRVARILLILLKRHMSLLTTECEMALSLITHLVEPDGTAPWKRLLCMEVFRGLYSEPGAVRLIYTLYDGEEGRKNILRDHMAALVRLASEKPSLIGDQITLETGGVAGVIGSTVPPSETKVPGISTQWSVVRTPYIDLLDKTDPPTPPDTYIYSLVLNCISSFAEGLAKFILPLTVPDLKQRRKNRLMSPSHVQYSAIKTCAGIIENCWPAVLAACSTFLRASLDDEYYHNLVRAFQKLAHVAGLLRLTVPRDAFLTTLGKAATPASAGGAKSNNVSATGSQQGDTLQKKRRSADLSNPTSLSTELTGTTAGEGPPVSLSTRNLLCMRALLNLGIALGPTLDQPAWSIIFETLQYTGLVIGMSSSAMVKSASGTGETPVTPGNDVPTANLGTEVIAVQAASNKMLESTSDFPSSSFEEILFALLNLSTFTEQHRNQGDAQEASELPRTPQSSQKSGRLHQGSRRVSHTVGKSRMQDEELKFVLEKGNELAKANLRRLSSLEEDDSTVWDLLTQSLISASANTTVSPNLRLQASTILNSLVFSTMKQRDEDDEKVYNQVQTRNLQTLKAQVASLYASDMHTSKSLPITVIEIHEQTLEVLNNILEQYAETFVDGWHLIFDLISGVFQLAPDLGTGDQSSTPIERRSSALPAGPRLVRAAYKSLHLVASDFLSLLPAPCLLSLVNAFSSFASQTQDFNISLTTTSFFWNVSDFLQGQIEQISIGHVDVSVSEEKLATLAHEEDPSISRNSLWLLLLLRIVDITTDSRPEIRNSAVHTLLRIFDAYGQQLSPEAWRLCLNMVLFKMAEGIETPLLQAKNNRSSAKSDDFKAWVDTTVVMIKGLSNLMTNFFETLVHDEKFDQSWKRLLKYLQSLINLHILDFSEATFSSLSAILLRVQNGGELSNDALECAWLLWANGHPAGDEKMLDLDQPNQDAALAYLRTFQQVYRLYKDQLTTKHIENVLHHLSLLVWNSVSPRYSPDVDRPSALQALVIDCIKTLCLEKEESQPDILLCLAELSDSALSKWSPGGDTRRPAFVAFSKCTIDLVSWYIAEFGIKQDVFTNGALAKTLEHLGALIVQKYTWQGKDREPFLWQNATTVSLNVLQIAVPYVEGQYTKANESETSEFWQRIVDITNGIVSARGFQTQQLPNARITADEAFDIKAFNRLKTLILPSLGAAAIPDAVRRDFARALFHSSFIYAPLRFDLPTSGLENAPLQDFYTVRPGRTFDPPPTLRPGIAYVLLDTLFELAAHSQAKAETEADAPSPQTLLARSISPYLLLRCAVSLKSYIADQPLRGLMPQPTPARKALLHLLLRMVELKSEPSAIPDPPSLKTVSVAEAGDAEEHHYRKHLEWIYPLAVRAVQVAGKERDDGQILQALGKVLQEIGRFEY
ncbi:Pc22g05210 [Penicillium rubens Wisconsin 54-1255]|uniref:Pc22g05210 protein n=1 Tax=Penicillium rubens (strain ATCC 28089 / DSM 1075 / NRRL 1951 / Wisconsin 54-1255) TaxID=500485 RepID=B6HUD4_PENRW|nr:Pc22g05210 [Penicillium rubens Wisconsin 54-1255]